MLRWFRCNNALKGAGIALLDLLLSPRLQLHHQRACLDGNFGETF
jgi:hypothetical protein